MSPGANVINLETTFIGSSEPEISSIASSSDIDPDQAEILESHIKQSSGGSLVSICL
ncbi:hypothetical protein ACFL37_01575 [Candidatus Margulisiibacteriota bacterium]